MQPVDIVDRNFIKTNPIGTVQYIFVSMHTCLMTYVTHCVFFCVCMHVPTAQEQQDVYNTVRNLEHRKRFFALEEISRISYIHPCEPYGLGVRMVQLKRVKEN